MNVRLVAGPWVGEFGWELMSWQGYIRALSRGFKETICFGPKGHQVLYGDFASRYIPIVELPGLKDCWWVDQAGAQVMKLEKTVGLYDGTKVYPRSLVPLDRQEFIRFGDPSKAEDRYDVLFHIRGPVGKRKNHQWNIRNAEKVGQALLDEGYKGGVIGTANGAQVIPGFKDLRGIELGKLMDVISAAKVVVGPSSGPMHLASLCGTPHVVWTDRQFYSMARCTNRERFERVWNPLKTRVEVIDKFDWNPPDSVIVEKVKELLCKTPMRSSSAGT